MLKESMKLKENKVGYTGGFEPKNRKKEMMYVCCFFKNERKIYHFH